MKKIVEMLGILLFAAMPLCAFAQNVTVSGSVTDSDGQPVIGAPVVQQGTGNSVVTDLDGKYVITVPADAYLRVSPAGYMERKVSVKGRSQINLEFTREDEIKDLAVIGYGVQEEGQVTTSVSFVGEKEFENRSTTDAASALQGTASGLQVINTSNAPGSIAELRVRGYSSMSSEASAPIIVVDGLRVESLQYLDPSMVESVEVLKDAGAAAIYGAGAGNGVVVITTKKGGKGAHVTYNGRFTLQEAGKRAEVFGASEYADYQKYIGNLTGDILDLYQTEGLINDTDWQKEMYAPSWSQQHGLTFQGGNDKGHFFASLNYLRNDGVARGDQDLYERITGQLNGDYRILKWLKFSTNNSFETWRTNTLTSGYGSVLNAVTSFDPLTPVYMYSVEQMTSEYREAYDASQAGTANYTFYGRGDLYATSHIFKESTAGHPFVQRDRINSSVGGRALRGVTAVDVQPWKWLSLTSRIGYHFTDNKFNNYSEPFFYSPAVKSDVYSLSEARNQSTCYQWDNFINFNNTWGRHTVGAMLGMSYKESNYDNTRISSSGSDIFQSTEPNYRYWDYLRSVANKTVSGAPAKTAQISVFGHLMYSYGGRYSIQASYSKDAYDSSRLATYNRWAPSWSISAGWTLSNENFFKNNVSRDIVSHVKLRGSYGKISDANGLSGYRYASSIVKDGVFYQYGSSAYPTYGSEPSFVANPDLKWETTAQTDLGLETRFLRDRLSFSFDWYKKNTKDIYVYATTLSEAGSSSICLNGGDVVNSGWDFDLGWRDHIGDFKYSINANLSTLDNTVERVDPSVGCIYGGGVDGFHTGMTTTFEEGQSMWSFYGYKYAGVDKKTGLALYYDKEGELTTTPSESDRQHLGSSIPTFTYGISVNFEWKGIDLSVLGTGSAGNKIYYMADPNNSSKANTLTTFWRDSWRSLSLENASAAYPDMAKVAGDSKFLSSDAYLFNGSYFKFKQIQLGYTLPRHLTRKAAISALRFFVSLDDYFTITTYPGIDPETAMYNTSYARGFDTGTYPITKKMVFGVNLTF